MWVNFLHIYQPPTQFPEILAQISQTCYRRLIALFRKYPASKATININASLTELWVKYHHEDIIEGFKELIERGQIELTGSAKYHALLPKLPRNEIIRQILINSETNKLFFGKSYQPAGFFPPEMGYCEKVGEVLHQLGFKWVIMDEAGFPKTDAVKKNNIRYRIKNTNVTAVFRDQDLSLKVAFSNIRTKDEFKEYLQKNYAPGEYVITAMDGETFGHHAPHQMELLEAILADESIKTATVSEMVSSLQNEIEIAPLRSTWGISVEDALAGRIYPRWENPKNPIHKRQWELTFLAYRAMENLNEYDNNFQEVRELMDKALHSDQYWWASHNPCWHPLMIEKGARMLRDVVQEIKEVPPSEKHRANQLYESIINTGKKLYGDTIVQY